MLARSSKPGVIQIETCEGDLSHPKRSGREKIQIGPILGENTLIFYDLVT